MIKVYVMKDCQDCKQVKEKLKDNPNYEIIDISDSVRNLKEFIKIRDNSKEFDCIRKNGYIGIPCFIYEDGTISFELPFKEETVIKTSCRLDGTGC